MDILPYFKKPMFVTSSREEIPSIDELLRKMTLSEKQAHFKPEGKGYHGSKSLWQGIVGGEEYWKAIRSFLEKLN